MPMPWSYRHATRDWQAFLGDARDAMDLTSDNMAYTAIEGVLLAFRARLTLAQVLAFADILPAVLRAIFVHHLAAEHQPVPLPGRAELVAEIKAHRKDHNLTPDNVIEATAFALHRAVNARDLARVLSTLPPDLAAFWDVPGVDAEDLERRIV